MVFRAPISSITCEVIHARSYSLPLILHSRNSIVFDFTQNETFDFTVQKNDRTQSFSMRRGGNYIFINEINHSLRKRASAFNIEDGRHEWNGLVIVRKGYEVSVMLQPPELSPQSIPNGRQPVQTLIGLGPIRTFDVESDEPIPASVPEEAENDDIRATIFQSDMPKQIAIAEIYDNPNYVQTTSVENLQTGDLIPGRDFDMRNPRSLYRELLRANFNPTYGSKLYFLLERSKVMARQYHGIELANKVADIVNKYMSSSRRDYGRERAGEIMDAEEIVELGGVCRHRSFILWHALQAAGLNVRYVIGRVLMGGPHAWVEIEMDGLSHVIDLQMRGGIRGRKARVGGKEGNALEELFGEDGETIFKLHDENKGDSILYLFNPNKFNVVWRRVG